MVKNGVEHVGDVQEVQCVDLIDNMQRDHLWASVHR